MLNLDSLEFLRYLLPFKRYELTHYTFLTVVYTTVEYSMLNKKEQESKSNESKDTEWSWVRTQQGCNPDQTVVVFTNKRRQAKVSTMYFSIDSIQAIYTRR